MVDESEAGAALSLEIAERWCVARGDGWKLLDTAGRGGTAPVYVVDTPKGRRALKLYDEYFSSGAEGVIQEKRIDLQKRLGDHSCSTLVKVYEGGRFESRLYVLMSLAPGAELEKELGRVPRSSIRKILSDVAKAAFFLEQQGLCHRDIKSANIFVNDDFSGATLLDISVLRDLHDPVGLGTDHGNQLPMIATARYSPPEYLFRLLEPNEASWKALTIYQLGTVLHDMIMRVPLFQDQYEIAGDNRYRFAWAVATLIPAIDAPDVPRDLINLARRALDKDWKKRLDLSTSDFFDDVSARRSSASNMLGFTVSPERRNDPVLMPARVLGPIAQNIEDALALSMLEDGVRAEHEYSFGVHPPLANLAFSWSPEPEKGETTYKFDIQMEGTDTDGVRALSGSARLLVVSGSGELSAQGSIATLMNETTFVPDAVEALRDLLTALAVKLSGADA